MPGRKAPNLLDRDVYHSGSRQVELLESEARLATLATEQLMK